MQRKIYKVIIGGFILLCMLWCFTLITKASDTKKLTYSTTRNTFSMHTNQQISPNDFEYYYSTPQIVKASLYSAVTNEETNPFKYTYTFSILPISTGETDIQIKCGDTILYDYHYEVTPLYDEVESCVGHTEIKYLYGKELGDIQYYSDYADITTESVKNDNNMYDYTITITYNKAVNDTIQIYDNYGNVIYNINADISAYHDFGSWITTKEATYTEQGEKYRVCSRCNFKEIARIDRKWDDIPSPITTEEEDIDDTSEEDIEYEDDDTTDGTTIDNAISTDFGNEYVINFGENVDESRFITFALESNGYVTLITDAYFDESTDSYGDVSFIFYDKNKKKLLEQYAVIDDESGNASLSLGLKEGTYYCEIVSHAIIMEAENPIDYSMTLYVDCNENGRFEIEPNNTKSTATEIKSGTSYIKTYYGAKFDNADDDYWFYNGTKDETIIVLLESASVPDDIYDSSGKACGVKWKLKEEIDDNLFLYTTTFVLPKTSKYYIEPNSYSEELEDFIPIEYSISVTAYKTINTKTTTATIKNSVYTGKAIKNLPTVKYNGTTLKKDTDYTVSYKTNTNVGLAKVTITGKGKYKGSITKTFKILPKGTSFTKVSSNNKSLVLKWTLQKTKMKSSYITGYQVQYSTTKDFSKNNKLLTISGYKNGSKTIKNLTKNKTYYVRIRTYKIVGGVKYFSTWSSIKSIKIK